MCKFCFQFESSIVKYSATIKIFGYVNLQKIYLLDVFQGQIRDLSIKNILIP
jgi:hypothetical protein